MVSPFSPLEEKLLSVFPSVKFDKRESESVAPKWSTMLLFCIKTAAQWQVCFFAQHAAVSFFLFSTIPRGCSLAVQVGAELLYIAQAPKLALNDNDFVAFPDVSRISEPYDEKVCVAQRHDIVYGVLGWTRFSLKVLNFLSSWRDELIKVSRKGGDITKSILR